MNARHASDGPPPYRVSGLDRVTGWKASVPEERIEFEVDLWISGLYWDPWQKPSWSSSPPDSRNDEVRRAMVPGTRVGVSYAVNPRTKYVRILEVADLP